MDSLFAQPQKKPLADRMRPTKLGDFVGQETAVGEQSPLRRMIEKDQVQSVLFYGPPGTGKTTLAQVIAHMTGDEFVAINAVSSGVPELRKLIAKAQELLLGGLGRTIVFIDEIHRFNKAQQDVLLPYVENGTIILIGATTENPFFEINSPLLSRMKVIRLEHLQADSIKRILERALTDKEKGYGLDGLTITGEALDALADFAGGDARVALNLLEQAEFMLPEGSKEITMEVLRSVVGNALQRYDKKGDYHYDIVSAFIKSMRGSDPDAAVYYLAKMLYAGEDVKFIARRIMILASEDIGNADPQALQVAVAAAQAVERVGMPESQIILSQAVTYMACAPKSNAAVNAIFAAMDSVKHTQTTVPVHLQDAHYGGHEKLGKGIGYKYAHDYPGHYVEQQYLPSEIEGSHFYEPGDLGYEKTIKEYLQKIKGRTD